LVNKEKLWLQKSDTLNKKEAWLTMEPYIDDV